MAVAAAGGVGDIEFFRSKLTENITTLYSALSEKLVGQFSMFKEVAKDTEIKSLRDILAIYLNWKRRVQTGGVRFGYANLNRRLNATKAIGTATATSNILPKFPNIGAFELEGNAIVKTNLERPHVVILGGGPAGLYLAILLKKSIPALNVLVLENRVDPETHARKLTRKRYFKFNNANLIRTDSEDDNEFDRFFHAVRQAGLLDLLYINDTHLDFFKNIINSDAYPLISISYGELRLAAFAQRLGVKIHHVVYGEAGIEDYLRANFINDNLLAIFDATGGRVYNNFKDVAIKSTARLPGEDPISIYEAAVNPDIAVRLFPGTTIPFIGVGDSIVRANFIWGNGLAINGIIMLFYVFLFREYYDRYLSSSAPAGEGARGGGAATATRRARRRSSRGTRRRRLA